MPRALFITASGTGIGKTLVTAGLCWQLRQQGEQVRAIKPVITGFDAAGLAESDTGILLAAQGMDVTLANADHISPWRYAEPVSPHLAALHEESAITDENIEIFCQGSIARGHTLIEGAGGILSPLLQGFTQVDLVQRLDIPVLLLGGSYLGSISHTLTAAETLLGRGISLASILISESAEPGASLEETRAAVASHLSYPTPVFTLPRQSLTTGDALWEHLPPLTGIIGHDEC